MLFQSLDKQRGLRWLGAGVIGLSALGCSGTQTAGTATAAMEPSAANTTEWPRSFVTAPGEGPALYLTPDANSPAIGYVDENVAFDAAGAPQNGRIRVRIRGGVTVVAWLAADRMGMIAQRRSKVRGTPAYVGPGDLVQYVAPGENAQVRVLPVLGCEPACELESYEGSYPSIGLAATAPGADAEAPNPGVAKVLPSGLPLPLYDRPGGQVVATLPAVEPPLVVEQLVERNGWFGIRAGTGPYLIGYTDQVLADAEGPRPVIGEAAHSLPAGLLRDEEAPLWRLDAGVQLRFGETTIGELQQPGFAREINRYENTGEVDVLVAVDDDVTLRGIVPISALQPAEG